MTCDECKYHSYINGTHFCESRNHKRNTVRIDNEDSNKDIECYWAESEVQDADKVRIRNEKQVI